VDLRFGIATRDTSDFVNVYADYYPDSDRLVVTYIVIYSDGRNDESFEVNDLADSEREHIIRLMNEECQNGNNGLDMTSALKKMNTEENEEVHLNEIILKNAENHIQQMGLFQPNVLNDFKGGIVNYSEEPHSILFWATDAQNEVIDMLERKGACKVWHIIKGTYVCPGGERQQIETYLLAIEEKTEFPEWNDGFSAYSYSRFLSAGPGDYGDVIIKPINGGLKRTV